MHPNQSLIKHAALWDKLWRAGKLSSEAMTQISKGLTGDRLGLMRPGAKPTLELLIRGTQPKRSINPLNRLFGIANRRARKLGRPMGEFRQAAKDWEMARPLESLGGVSRNQMDDVMGFTWPFKSAPGQGWAGEAAKMRNPTGLPRLASDRTLTYKLPRVGRGISKEYGPMFQGGFFTPRGVKSSPNRPLIAIRTRPDPSYVRVAGSSVAGRNNPKYRAVLRHELGHWKHYKLSQSDPRKLDLSARMLFNRMRQASPAHFDVLQQSKGPLGGSNIGFKEILAEYFAGAGRSASAKRYREFKHGGLNSVGRRPDDAWRRAILERYGRNTPLANPAAHIQAGQRRGVYLHDVPRPRGRPDQPGYVASGWDAPDKKLIDRLEADPSDIYGLFSGKRVGPGFYSHGDVSRLAGTQPTRAMIANEKVRL